MADPDLWLRAFHPSPAAPVQVVCLPHAGGSATFFHPISARTAPGLELLAVQYPGRQDRRHEPLPDSIEQLAGRVAEAVTARVDRPFVLLGHSMGALVAYEVARRLPPRALVVSGRRAPHCAGRDDVHRRDDPGLVRELRELGGTEAGLLRDEELLGLILPVVRADYRALERYRYTAAAPLNCPLTVLTGEADPRTTLAEADAWRAHTTGGFTRHTLPGGHFFPAEQPAAFADRLREAALAGSPTPPEG